MPYSYTPAPELTDTIIDKIVEGTEHQAAGRSVKELERRRDAFLNDLLKLVKNYWPEAEGRPDHI
jgi:carnitine 3-dehydrogenase